MRPPPLKACPHCGSRRLRIPGVAEGVVADWDNLMPWVCEECGVKATPLEFDDGAAADAFRRARQADPAVRR